MNSKTKPQLSVVLATFNEADNIQRCLAAIQDLADEIIVVDGQSTDQTAELALELGARVITTTNKPIFHINKQMAIDAARGDWILQLDADEVVNQPMKTDIKRILHQGSPFTAFRLKRKNYFLGRFLTKGGQYPDPVIRFFKKGQAYLPQKSVHEQLIVKGDIGWLQGHLLHYNAPTFSRYITNANRYTSLTAAELQSARIKLNLFNDINYLFIKPIHTFTSIYFRHRGYQDGFPGFVFALFSGLHYALSYMKLGDLERQNH